MFKILFKKQMTELFKSYFLNRKTGKLRDKKQIAFFILFFFVILVFLAVSFSSLSKMLAASLVPLGFDILYFEILGAVSLGFGIFGSVFTSYEMLYNAKDNDFLLSMPIKPSAILGSRMLSSYIISVIYEAVIYIPAVIEYCRYAGFTPAGIILPSLNLFISGFAVLTLTCLFGWFMAAASSKTRNKNFFSMAASLIALGLYYTVMFRINDLVNAVLSNPTGIEKRIRQFAFPLYLFGSGSQGNITHFILFALLTSALTAVTAAAMSRTFIRLVTANKGLKKKGFKSDSVKSGSIKSALLRKEAARFFNTPILILNSGIGLIICPAAAIAALVKSSSLNQLTASVPSPEIIPGLILTVVCFMCSISESTESSVSLEGNSLWILQTMPVKASQILLSKIKISVILTVISSEISLLLFSAAFHIRASVVIIMIIALAANNLLRSSLGLIFNLRRPNFDWTNEAIPVKQDSPVLFSMLSGMGFAVIPAALGAALMHFPAEISAAAAALIYTAALIPALKWINTKGAECFKNL